MSLETHSEAQIRRLRANRANARKSTGPLSIAGKKASRQNARKHGLSAKTSTFTLKAEIASALPAHLKPLANTIATSFDTLAKTHQLRSEYVAAIDLQVASLDEFRTLTAKLSRLEKYEQRASSRLTRLIVEILLTRAR